MASPEDNVAIATRIIYAGTNLRYSDADLSIEQTILEGHRFALNDIAIGDMLLSWSQPFGVAISPIKPGGYIVNDAMLTELNRRPLDFPKPASANFSDDIPGFALDEANFNPSPPLSTSQTDLTFMGYPRSRSRGTGTRNTIVLLGTSSLAAGFVRVLEQRLKPLIADYQNIDDIVAVPHTEGAFVQPNNRELVLRTLAGFMVHANVGAVLAVDYGSESINNTVLHDYMRDSGYPLDDVLHAFMSMNHSFQANLEYAENQVRSWLSAVNTISRESVPISQLKIALQCGGSDAFSGISGNPLAAWVAREIIRGGGSANLAETDELVGAESYTLDKVKDVATAKQFLALRDGFIKQVARFGHSVRGNPSGGNVYRGLYNIYLKSLGAAMKRNPDVRLDAVIEYGERMQESGFYFMDSPGNDLESIAGQVAAGCNVIFFVTGNGSITNFPFVPTIKIVTTSARYELLRDEMDVNAGSYLDGQPMDELGLATLSLTRHVASGQKTVGERAGHSQVQIWRNWHQPDPVQIQPVSGEPCIIHTDVEIPELQISMYLTDTGYAANQFNLILPTSLCSGQIARMCVERLNQRDMGRFVTLVHTEGCASSAESEHNVTLVGYLQHPSIQHALLLEHGCEITHNGYMNQLVRETGFDPERFGWASVQLDGGIQAVMEKMTSWFEKRVATSAQPETINVGVEGIRIGLMTRGGFSPRFASQIDLLTRQIVGGGGTIILPHYDKLLEHDTYLKEIRPKPTLSYAMRPAIPGFHIMQMPFDQWGEALTGIGAAGVDLIVLLTSEQPLPAHPMIPVLQVATDNAVVAIGQSDYDLNLGDDVATTASQLLDKIVAVLSRHYVPRQNAQANVDFQITRGFKGVSF